MNKTERIKAALNKEAVDRVPVSVWMHYPAVDQDAFTLAETQVDFQRSYDLDFIKLMPFGLYSAQDWGCQVKFFCDATRSPVVHKYAIADVTEWNAVDVLPPHFGNWGQATLLAKAVGNMVGDKVPFVQTVFSPLTTACKLAGPRVYNDLRENGAIVHRALEAITETTLGFIRENMKTGIAGIFYATQSACFDFLTREEYREFGRRYDFLLLEEASKQGWFNILHIHGQNLMFREMADYPVHALNWHDRQEYPSLREARQLTDKCLLGGLDEKGPISRGTPADVAGQVKATVAEAGESGLIIGPGCVVYPDTPPENIYAARLAVERGD